MTLARFLRFVKCHDQNFSVHFIWITYLTSSVKQNFTSNEEKLYFKALGMIKVALEKPLKDICVSSLGGREECVDMDKRCKKWAVDGECTKNKAWMIKNCRLSCRSCAGERNCKVLSRGFCLFDSGAQE